MTLPVEYQEVEYIESSGATYQAGQYIDTGFTFTENAGQIKMKVMPTSFGSNYYDYRCGGSVQQGGTNRAFVLYLAYSTPYIGLGSNDLSTGKSVSVNNIYEWDIQANSGSVNYSVNGDTGSATYSGGLVNGKNYYIFCNFEGNTGHYYHANMKLYYFQIYQSGTLVRDFIPCYRKSDNVIGMYDLVNDQFYTNQGTGTFTKGPDVLPPVPKFTLHGAIQTFHWKRPYEWKPLNPKCWYKFDGDYTDSTGNFGVASGTSTFQTLASGVKVLQTDGTNMVSLPSGITANSLSTFTIIFWMKPITANPNYGYYAGCGNDGNTHISFYENTSGRDFVGWTDGYRDLTTSGVDAGWRLVCFRSDGSNCDLIINGSNKTATTTAPTIFGYSTYNTFVLGARTPDISTDTGQRTSVQISNFIISDSYWDDAECLEMYNQTKSNYGL